MKKKGKQDGSGTTVSKQLKSLPPEKLRLPCDPTSLGFNTTAELPRLSDVIGQPRAFKSLELGSDISGQGYNVFVLGAPSSGRKTLSRDYLERKASTEPVPDDWCYVNNFSNPHQPKAINLPPGQAVSFQKNMEALISQCKEEISSVFKSEEYSKERDRLTKILKEGQENELTKLQELVAKDDFLIAQTPYGIALVPLIEGKPLSPDNIDKLSSEQRSTFRNAQSKLEEHVKITLRRIRKLEKKAQDDLRRLKEQTALYVVGHLVEDYKKEYQEIRQVNAYLDLVQEDIITHVDRFQASNESDNQSSNGNNWLHRYTVNVAVDNSELNGAPVIVENMPTYHNLLGRIEHEVVMGTSRTDFSMIRPGALHRANGGYLLLPARDVLKNPFAWEGLERALRENTIRVIEIVSQLSLINTATLNPEPIPLKIKVILVGTPMLYYLLRSYDEDFSKLFKVKAEFTTIMDRTAETENEYALFVKSVVDDNGLKQFDASAVARIIEYGSRLTGNKDKLSTQFGKIADLIRESAYWAKEDKSEIISIINVEHALKESIYRNNLIEERIQELIFDGTLMIDVDGEAVGQINALSIMILGDYSFGRPNRVTAVAYPGRGNIIDIERQAKLGGPTHTKGVLIISGYLGNRYGRNGPLSLTASLTFEQSYEEIRGDSASAAELLALLSAIARIPIKQNIAITGSVNQNGQIQAIGGVNQKIEGFFNICKLHGLTKLQGVIIPQANVRNLMLNKEITEAVESESFNIWSINNIDEGIGLLTDMEVGEQKEDGSYPEGTFNYFVRQKLSEFTKVMKAATKRPAKNNSKDENKGNSEQE